MDKRIVNEQRQDIKTRQMAMARNIAALKTKSAQKRQAHFLCESLVRGIKERF